MPCVSFAVVDAESELIHYAEHFSTLHQCSCFTIGFRPFSLCRRARCIESQYCIVDDTRYWHLVYNFADVWLQPICNLGSENEFCAAVACMVNEANADGEWSVGRVSHGV